MDNNQNFGQQPQQPVNNGFNGQQPQQQMNNTFNGQQPMNNGFPQQQMNGNPFGMQQPPQPPKFNVLELVSIICAGVGFLMVFLGTIFTCTCSAAKWGDTDKFGLSPIFILTIFGIMASAAGIVIAIMALKKTDAPVKADKIAKIAIVIGAAAVVFGILPLVTICGYNCSLNGAEGDEALNKLGELSSSFDNLMD